ncbi:MAG: sodium/solute symporter [Pirellulales bacterium]|nr:sodium/solute symporter [Pirellulales bacterium]
MRNFKNSKTLVAVPGISLLTFAFLSACFFTIVIASDSTFAQAVAQGEDTEAAPAEKSPQELAVLSDEQREKAVATMRRVLAEEERWVKVHAAEYLLELDYSQGVLKEFNKELEKHGDEPEYRIGIWRVLVRGTNQKNIRFELVEKIKAVGLDAAAPDQLHAIETLGKLGVAIGEEELGPIKEAAKKTTSSMGVYAQWVLVNSGQDDGAEKLSEYLDSHDPKLRNTAAYVFTYLKNVSPAVKDKIAAAADKDPTVALITAAALHGPKEDRDKRLQQLVEYTKTVSVAKQRDAALGLARAGKKSHAPLLFDLVGFDDADLQIAASYAACKVARRTPRQMSPIDWCIIAVYALGMVVVGWYYSRRTANTEDYLLGGRQMRPLAVGLSLFATMLSTISYLSWPGEMIKNGPMIMCIIAGYPLVFLTVGYLIIPKIMRLRVTSAYEILETRLGLTVRMMGSTIFLLLRLLWMSVIIYATSGTVLVPLMGLDASATPYVCAAMGIVTVIYTSMGGLKAVVFTDVVQTIILFGGAILAVILISVFSAQHLGEAFAWWPTEWAPHWQEPSFTFNPFVRVSAGMAMLAMFTWYVCTNCSDQMAIQRYLATRDAKAARKVILVSLISDGSVAIFLNILGLALLGFFMSQPHLLDDEQMIMENADQLFPRFIAIGLPVGVSGLVVAGLLAAAMSSLSSGINSSCSVISVDFIDRFRSRADRIVETDHVRMAKYISGFVGVAVVFLSSFVCMVEGNLIEIAYKVVNLFTVPLAGLFIMAMFVRWATAFGTIVGAVAGLVVVVAINYWEEITGRPGISFLCAMPAGLIVQMAVGMIASIPRIGRRACETEGYDAKAEVKE